MTKTLTEQWREGELPNGEYYVKDWDGTINWFVAQNKILWRDLNNPIYTSERIEVLSVVPNYDEYKRLQEQLADASKTIERLQEQLKEANEVIKDYDYYEPVLTNEGKYLRYEPNSAKAYLKKWGVK